MESLDPAMGRVRMRESTHGSAYTLGAVADTATMSAQFEKGSRSDIATAFNEAAMVE